jgi:regulator of protease activity HflC (stomatin/prohibitin superfamily)
MPTKAAYSEKKNLNTLIVFLPIILAFFFAILFLTMALRIVPEHQRCVIFRLGRFMGVYGPGLFFLIPMLDQIVVMDLREQVQKIEGEIITTQDRGRVLIGLLWGYKVIDPAKAVLEVKNLEVASQEMATAVLRSAIGSMTLDDVLAGREQIRTQLHTRLSEITAPWGVEVTNVEIRDLRKY